jgi:cyclopropane fatty-acyl-phospholipid synthase-like methyltransferase
MSVRDGLLGSHLGYSSFLKLIRADRFLETFAVESLHLTAGQRLLDLGCGNGALAAHVPDVEYTGIDNNQSYIDSAERRFGGPRRRFICEDLSTLAETERGTFDAVCAVGVLHHLDDELAVSVIRTGLELLVDGGRFVTVDPVFHPDQRTVARLLMAMDRGKFVRHPEHYRSLVGEAGAVMTDRVRFDLNPFPYTHFLMEMTPADPSVPQV